MQKELSSTYEPHTQTIILPDGVAVLLQAQAAVGTGLGYTIDPYIEGETAASDPLWFRTPDSMMYAYRRRGPTSHFSIVPPLDAYVLTHLASGCAFQWVTYSEEVVREWLRAIASLTNWARPRGEIELDEQSRQAFVQADALFPRIVTRVKRRNQQKRTALRRMEAPALP